VPTRLFTDDVDVDEEEEEEVEGERVTLNWFTGGGVVDIESASTAGNEGS
jgi:hypothetical protein